MYESLQKIIQRFFFTFINKEIIMKQILNNCTDFMGGSNKYQFEKEKKIVGIIFSSSNAGRNNQTTVEIFLVFVFVCFLHFS